MKEKKYCVISRNRIIAVCDNYEIALERYNQEVDYRRLLIHLQENYINENPYNFKAQQKINDLITTYATLKIVELKTR